MNALLAILLLVVGGGIVYASPDNAPAAMLLAAVFSGIAILFILRTEIERQFLLRVFLAGLLVRLVVGTIIFKMNLQDFFGGDATTYDENGFFLQQGWHGNKYFALLPERFLAGGSGAWGMLYMVAGIYEVIGRNPLAIQFINAVVGAATAVVIFLCAFHIFGNTRVARVAAFLTAFFPSLVLWSSQGLKDGPIVFTLALSILATLKLGQRLTVKYFLVLAGCLMCLMSLRFYIFYMMFAAVVGAFVIGVRSATTRTFARRFVVIVGIGLAMTWFGVIRYANAQFLRYGNLEAVQRSRLDLAQSAKSGFGRDVDVSTVEGALSEIPRGLVNLLFAPFPWEVSNLRQSLTLPEMFIWWAAVPLLVVGLWFSIRYKLREISPILIFTVMLSLAYSIFQGNVGTAYRQRAQLLVFYFIFVAVGVVLVKEKREERARRIKEEGLAESRQRQRWKVKPAETQVAMMEDEAERIKA